MPTIPKDSPVPSEFPRCETRPNTDIHINQDQHKRFTLSGSGPRKGGLMLVSHNSKLALYTLDGKKIEGVRSIKVSAASDEITVATVEIEVTNRDSKLVINRFTQQELDDIQANFSIK